MDALVKMRIRNVWRQFTIYESAFLLFQQKYIDMYAVDKQKYDKEMAKYRFVLLSGFLSRCHCKMLYHSIIGKISDDNVLRL